MPELPGNFFLWAASVSSALGGVALIAASFVWVASRKAESSLAEKLGTEGLPPNVIINVIRSIRSGKHQVQALSRLLSVEKARAELLLSQLQSSKELALLVRNHDSHQFKRLVAISLTLLLLAGLCVVAERAYTPSPDLPAKPESPKPDAKWESRIPIDIIKQKPQAPITKPLEAMGESKEGAFVRSPAEQVRDRPAARHASPDTPPKLLREEVDVLREERDQKCQFGAELGTKEAIESCKAIYDLKIRKVLEENN